jgi:hypothetical protein
MKSESKIKNIFYILLASFLGLMNLSLLGFGAFYIWNEALNERQGLGWYIFAIFGSLVFIFFSLGYVVMLKKMINESKNDSF